MEIGPIIKNPVLDINKLVRQGTMLNQSVQNVEGDSTADQATVDLLARKDPVIQEISVGMSGEELTQYTVSGTPPLSLPNSLGKPLKAWSVEVSPYQEGSGDPSPDNVRPIHGTDKLNLFVEESYDPSVTPKAVITLPSTVYTATIGSSGGESRSTAIDMGSLTWSYSATYNRMSCSPIAEVKPPLGTEINAYCEMFKVVTANYGWTHRDTEQMIAIDESGYIRVYSPPYTYPAEFTSAVSGKKLICELATPTTFSVPSVTIPTPTGTATTWATAEDGTVDSMEVTYVGKV